VRYLLLSVHYRQKLNFTFPSVEAAGAALRRIDDLRFRLGHARERDGRASAVAETAARLAEDFGAALADDLNTSAALAAVHGFARDVNVAIEQDRLAKGDRDAVGGALHRADAVLGVLHREQWSAPAEPAAAAALPDGEIESLVAQREAARRGRDFRRSDAIRDQLRDHGVLVEDTAAGPRWRRS
jgi:cysteinyl-tRNA synthetase